MWFGGFIMSDIEKIKEEIKERREEYFKKNNDIIQTAFDTYSKAFDVNNYIVEHHNRLKYYLKKIKIMIITANQVEAGTLHGFFLNNEEKEKIKKISYKDLTYFFFELGNIKIVHVPSNNIGSHTDGGVVDTLNEAIKKVKPAIVISLGVAFGANYIKQGFGDVLVGQQYLSYDKSSKISDNKLTIKRLHIFSASANLLNRINTSLYLFRSNNDGNKYKVHVGNFITGEFVVDDVSMQKMFTATFEPLNFIGGEMEAYGLFKTVFKSDNISCIMIKGICDWAINKNEEESTSDGDGEDLEEEFADDAKTEESTSDIKDKLQAIAMYNVCEFVDKYFFDEKSFSDIPTKLKWFYKRSPRVYWQDIRKNKKKRM